MQITNCDKCVKIKMEKKETIKKSLISRVYRNPKYKGRHIIVIGGKIFDTKTGRASSDLLEKLLKKYPKEIPTIAYIPTEDSLILSIL